MASYNGEAVKSNWGAYKQRTSNHTLGPVGMMFGGASSAIRAQQVKFPTNGQPAPPCQQQMSGMLDDLLWPVTVGLRTLSIACFNPAAAMTPYPYIQVLAEPLMGLGAPLMAQAAVLGWQTLEISFTASGTGAVRVRRVVPCSFGWCFWDNIVLT